MSNHYAIANPETVSQDKIFFHHMVGTGGNSFAAALSRCEPGYQIVQLTANANGYRLGDIPEQIHREGRFLFYGHNLFRLPETAGIFTSYVTMLRHPIERLLSDFFWSHQAQPRHEAFAKFCEWVEYEPHLEFYIHHCGPLDFRNSQHFNGEECTADNAGAERDARMNLASVFQFVGITEMFDQSLYQFARQIGLNAIAPWWRTRHPGTPLRPNFFDFPKRTRQIVESKCGRDISLYEELREKFVESCKEFSNHPEYLRYVHSANSRI